MSTYGTQQLFGVPLGYLEGANPSIRFPLFVDYASASGLKARSVDGGTLWLAPSTDAPTRDALVTMSLANAAGREWRVIRLGGVRLTQAKLDSGAWALVVVDAADASAANYRAVTVDGGTLTTVFTGTGDYRALLVDAAADVSANPVVRNVFGGLVAFNSTNGGSALLGGGGAAPAAPTVSAAPTGTGNIRTTITNIDPTATTLKIYRSTDNVSFSLIDAVAVSGTSQNYDDGTITAGTNYWYKVGANNAGGEGLSAASNKVNTLTYLLESYWKFDEASGTRSDSVGSNHFTENGTGGVGTAAGILGNAADLVAADSDYFSLADNASISAAANTSFEIDGFFYIPSHGASNDVWSKRNDYLIQLGSTIVAFSTWHGGVIKQATKSLTINAGQWYYFNASFDSPGQLTSIDINNSGTRGTVATSSGTVDNGTDALTIAKRNNASTWMNLRICQGGYWKGRTLTASERTARYAAGAGFNGFLP